MATIGNNNKLPAAIKVGESPPFYKMDEYAFQDMCRDLFDNESSINSCSTYGIRGQSQEGIDLLAHGGASGVLAVGQCKCYEEFPPREIRNASDEFFIHLNIWKTKGVKKFILFVACDLNTTLRQKQIIKEREKFNKVGLEYEVWSAANIRNKLSPHREIVERYLNHSPYWVDDICGTISSSPISVASGEINTDIEAITDDQLSHFVTLISTETENKLNKMQRLWKEGDRETTLKWVKDTKESALIWGQINPSTRAKVISFEANLEIDINRDTKQAKILIAEAVKLDPSLDVMRTEALMKYFEDGPDVAIEYLGETQNIDCINLKAALLIEMGQVDESLELLDKIDGIKENE
jgi:hypothetical protein